MIFPICYWAPIWLRGSWCIPSTYLICLPTCVELYYWSFEIVQVTVIIFVAQIDHSAFQFVPSCQDRNHDRSRQVIMSLSHASYPDNWLAQQSLFMGSSTPLYRRQVSMSPEDSYPASSRYFSAPAVQGPMIDGVSPISGRSMYPSPTYNYGNPGFLLWSTAVS